MVKKSARRRAHPHRRLQSPRGPCRIARGQDPWRAKEFELHPNQITEWKRQLLEREAEVSAAGRTHPSRQTLLRCTPRLASWRWRTIF